MTYMRYCEHLVLESPTIAVAQMLKGSADFTKKKNEMKK